jgi:DNA-binding Xre family transcriptional regulator
MEVKRMDSDYGVVKMNIEELLEKAGISKNKICKDLDLPRPNFNKYCRNQFQRIDANLIAKLCFYLDCTVDELIKYEHPKKSKKK